MSELRRHRVNAHLSVTELADSAGVDASVIYRIEKGATRRPGLGNLIALADALTEALPDGQRVQPADIDPMLTQEAV
jgi:transcriptional regulator with XRE-family HTH domain